MMYCINMYNFSTKNKKFKCKSMISKNDLKIKQAIRSVADRPCETMIQITMRDEGGELLKINDDCQSDVKCELNLIYYYVIDRLHGL